LELHFYLPWILTYRQLRLIRRPSWNSIWPTPEVQS